MKRLEWLFALFLIAMGLSCLTMAGMGYSGQVIRFTSLTPLVIICVGFMVILGILVYAMLNRGKRSSLRCENCQQALEPDWNICPHCGSPIR